MPVPLYRTIIVIETITEHSSVGHDVSIQQLSHNIEEGYWIGGMTSRVGSRLSNEEAAKALRARGLRTEPYGLDEDGAPYDGSPPEPLEQQPRNPS